MTNSRRTVVALLMGYLTVTGTMRGSEGDAVDRAIAAAVASVEPSVVQLRYFGAGSGSLGAAATPVTGFDLGGGWLLTSTYALDSAPAGILCRFPDGSQEQAKLVARDTGRRLTLLSTGESGEPPALAFPGRTARVGETAIALGRVYNTDEVQRTVGVISAIDRFGGRAVQTDALASPTNYGGPLIGLDGALLGIITPMSPAGQTGVSLYDSGVGFAVPPVQIAHSLPTLAAGSDVHPGWLGASFTKGNPLTEPAVVSKIVPDGPAVAAGLKPKDRIVTLAGKPTPSLWRLRTTLSGHDAGETLLATVVGSGGASRMCEILLGEEPTTSKDPYAPDAEHIDDRMKEPDEP